MIHADIKIWYKQDSRDEIVKHRVKIKTYEHVNSYPFINTVMQICGHKYEIKYN